MVTLTRTTPRQWQIHDALEHLPCSAILEYRKDKPIYTQHQPSQGLYLVIEGRVKIYRTTEQGAQVLVDIYTPDHFFGESSLAGESARRETAVAHENSSVMAWTTAEIEEIAMLRPELMIALLQMVVQRSLDFGTRIETFSTDNIARRLAKALVRFSGKLGRTEEDGSTAMIPLTHELLSGYVGTSREIVTHYMNKFRRDGFLEYSRRGILLRQDRLREWLSPGPGCPESLRTSAAGA